MPTNSVKILPTSPITRALVAPPALLGKLLREAALTDRTLLGLVQRYANELKLAQDAAENLAQEIERRLRAVESTSMDVQNGTGNVFPLSSLTPLPVSAVSSVGSELASAHGDHTHEGVHSIESIVGDVDLVGSFLALGQEIRFPTWWNEATPVGAIDGVNMLFTLPAVPVWFLQVVKNGQVLFNGLGMTWTPGDAFFRTAIPPKAAVGAQPADALRVWMAS